MASDKDLEKRNVITKMFDLIGKSEKSIDLLYQYLLDKKKIDDLKEVCEELNISLKRAYKICAVLNDLDLVQIFDRPMKINLLNPIPAWQKLVNKNIDDMTIELEEKINVLKNSLNLFFKMYDLREPEVGEPIEFLNFDTRNFSWIFYHYLATNITKIAIGIVYKNPLIEEMMDYNFAQSDKALTENLKESFVDLTEHVKNIEIYTILNSNVLEIFLKTQKYSKLLEHMKFRVPDVAPKKMDVRITEEDFSNFSLRDDEMLIQPSFDPSNILLGAYISRQEDIVKIFLDKFDDLFEKSMPINEYISQHKIAGKTALSEREIMALGFLQ